MSVPLALDTNLLVMWVVGTVAPNLLGRHKGARAYTEADFNLLTGLVAAREVIVTPNSLTEVSNLVRQGFHGNHRDRATEAVASLALKYEETFIRSRQAVTAPEYRWLGLADAVWLEIGLARAKILTVDALLYRAALARGMVATNFNPLRAAYGTI